MPWNTLTLPPYEDYYIVTCKGGVKTTMLYYSEGEWTDDYENRYDVIAWMPMPEAYDPKNL